MNLVDSHCHLQDERFGASVEAVLARARAVGVVRFLSCGSSESDWAAVDDLARRHTDVMPAFGLHPWYVRGRTACWREALEERLVAWPAAAVGEVGLDHALESFDGDEQRQVFLEQLILARRGDRCVSIHCRRAWADLEAALAQAGPLPRGFVLHSYSGSREVMKALIRRGAWFSFSGSLTYPHNRRSRSVAEEVPLDRLLIETDAPDLPPWGVPRETPNEPMHLPRVLEELARIRGVAAEDLAARLWENAQQALGMQ